MEMKIAILILAHKNEKQLNLLINHLSTDFDIYVHLDKRCSFTIPAAPEITAMKKHNVYWGHESIVRATLDLLELAHQKKYDRYLLISGQDMPLKPNCEIFDFFYKNRSREFMEYDSFPAARWGERESWSRVDYYSPMRFPDSIWLRLVNAVLTNIRKVQVKIPPLRRNRLWNFYGGDQWFNLSGDCVDFLLSDKFAKRLLQRMAYTRCSDEIFFQTAVLNSRFKENCVNTSLRYLRFGKGNANPDLLSKKDYEMAKKTDALFARKFDYDLDNALIVSIYNDLKESNR